MPELPEVETTCQGIKPYLEGKTVKRMTVRQPSLRWPIPLDKAKALEGQSIQKVSRRGKYILLDVADGYWLIHLGMSGSMRVVTTDELPRKHDHVDLELMDGSVIRFNDPRRFGCWLFQPNEEGEHSLLLHLGVEPLSEAFNGAYLFKQSRQRQVAVKNFIMNSHVVVGVGNIYASESLFDAGISPKRAAGNISLARYEKLAASIKKILARSIEQGGTTLRDFINSDGNPGYFKQSLNVYDLEGQPCKQCSKPIKKITQGQRSTFFCSTCQT